MHCLKMLRGQQHPTRDARAAAVATCPARPIQPLPQLCALAGSAMIRHAGMLLAGAAAACLVSAPARAQEQRYETPQYTTGGGSTLDKSFGMPSFGMPPQRTQAPEVTAPERPDFFAKTPEYDVQKPRSSTALEMETPLFTTPEGSTTGDSTMTDSTFDQPASADSTMSRYTNPR